jgi:hypothetical protein
MGQIRQSRWAPLVPWGGIQDRPAYLGDTGIPISGVLGLQAILDSLEGEGGGSVAWSNITGKPAFGSAAYSPTSAFATSAQGTLASTALQPPTPDMYQSGVEPLVMGQTDYSILFSPVMAGTPEIDLQYHLTDGSSEMFYAGVRDDLTDGTGFTFRINSAPLASSGNVHWEARVP